MENNNFKSVIVGIPYTNEELNKDTIQALKAEYSKHNVSASIKLFNSKTSIKKELAKNPSVTDLIISESIKQHDPVDIPYLDELTDVYKELNVVYLVEVDKPVSFYKELHSHGLYNSLAGEVNLSDIVNLSIQPRKKGEAKLFYKLSDDDFSNSDGKLGEEVSSQEIKRIIRILRDTEDSALAETFSRIMSQWTDKAKLFIIGQLPESITNRLKDIPLYKKLEKRANKNRVVEEKVIEKIVEKTIVKTENIAVGTVEIGIIGTVNGVGTTTSAFAIAQYLAYKGKSVAVCELSDSGHYKSFSKGSLEYSEHNGVCIYPYREEYKELYNQKYDYIIYDLGALYMNGIQQESSNKKEQVMVLRRMTFNFLVTGHLPWQEIDNKELNTLNGIEFFLIEPLAARKNRKEYGELGTVTIPYISELLKISNSTYTKLSELENILINNAIRKKKDKTRFLLPLILVGQFAGIMLIIYLFLTKL